jgi:hypothetical protein
MKQPWENDSCEQIKSYFTIYPVRVAAALWCGIPPHQLNEHLDKSTEVCRGIFALPYIKCLEPRCRAIHNAIDNGILPVCREKGVPVSDHVAPERRHVRREDLKAWIAKEFPADKPAFLFDEVERNTHSAINAETYRALKAEHDAKEIRLTQANERIREIEDANGTVEMERNGLRAQVDNLAAKLKTADLPGERSEATYQNIIAALLDCIAGNLPETVKHPSFDNESKLIDVIDEHFRGYGGLSKSNLSRKFPEAKRNLQAR